MGEEFVEASFVEYKIKKYVNSNAYPHPGNVVESRNLSQVSPPDVLYQLKMEPWYTSWLSICQLEALVYGCQAHEQLLDNGMRKGFLLGTPFIFKLVGVFFVLRMRSLLKIYRAELTCEEIVAGDGAGMGKGRTIAGFIYENEVSGRKKSVWLSASQTLFQDARRDYEDLFEETKMKSRIFSPVWNEEKLNKIEVGTIVVTYSQLRIRGRVTKLCSWLGEDFDGIVALDDCHIGNNESTKIFDMIATLHKKLPLARFVYSSATAAGDPSQLKLMARLLGVWTDGSAASVDSFVASLESRGLIGMEALAMELKAKGLFLSRRLSMADSEFKTQEVKLDGTNIAMYNQCSLLWIELRKKIEIAHENKEFFQRKGEITQIYSEYWAAHQRFFRALCSALKVDKAVELARNCRFQRMTTVIGLQSTGESNVIAAGKGPKRPFEENVLYLEPYRSSVRMTFLNFMNKFFSTKFAFVSVDAGKKYRDYLTELEKKIKFPRTPLEEIIFQLGGVEYVAEMTGRSQRIAVLDSGDLDIKQRVLTNEQEQQQFMQGLKSCAIISDAASVGISLHDDKRVYTGLRRLHITLELPWSAEKTVQQFGRTHRSNQRSGPVYVLMVTDIAGEMRFVSAVAKRMRALGAITQGDRQSTIEGVANYALVDSYASKALAQFFKAIHLQEQLPVVMPGVEDYKQFFKEVKTTFIDVGLHALSTGRGGRHDFEPEAKVKRFMNRILGIKLPLQNQIYTYFRDIYDDLIERDKMDGIYNDGIYDLTEGKCIIETQHNFQFMAYPVSALTIKYDRAMDFKLAVALLEKNQQEPNNGFYKCELNGKELVYLAIKGVAGKYFIYRPHIGAYTQILPTSPGTSYVKCSTRSVMGPWKEQRSISESTCTHVWLHGSCDVAKAGGRCSIGKRYSSHTLLTGVMWSMLDKLEVVLDGRIQRSQFNDGNGIMNAIEIPADAVSKVMALLAEDEDNIIM